MVYIILLPALLCFPCEDALRQARGFPWHDDELAAKTFLYRTRRAEEEAIKVLSDEMEFTSQRASVLYAVEYLTAIRSKKSVPVLCKRLLHLHPEARFDPLRPPEKRYLVYPALVEIGTPAVGGLLNEIASGDTSVEYRRIAAGVLWDVVGEDRALDEIRRFKQKCEDPDRRRRIQRFEDEYAKWSAPNNPR